jgi:ribosome biogenesis protein NSA1
LSPEMNVGGSNQIIAVGTAYKEMMLYDVRMDATVPTRRPIWHSKEGSIVEHRVTAICEDTERKAMIVGDAAGYIHTVDLRRLGKEGAGRYNGPCGSVRALFKHPTLPILACVGLDRMLRTFDMTNRRKQLDCVYLKQRLNAMLFCHDDTWSPSDDTSPNIIEDNHVDTTMNFSEGDIEQDDDVRDYVDSDEEHDGDRSESDDDDDDEAEYETDDSGQEAAVVEDENDDAEDDSGSSEDEEDESGESDDSLEEEEMPKQRSRKQEGGKPDSKKKQRR